MPALLLLHGFPQTHVMWHRVAQHLQHDYFLVLPDLRGYGDSSQVAGPARPQQLQQARDGARTWSQLMVTLGAGRFFLCGHDRGGRVAHRLALDHPAARAASSA